MAIESTTQAGQAAPTAIQQARSNLGDDYTSFLKLLTAQIQNQDPLQPMDSTAFVSQLAQLSQVEQAVSMNANLEQLNAKFSAISAMSDIQLIGREVTLSTDRLELSGGKASFDYQLASPAGLVKAVIKAGDGTVVREYTGLAGTAGGKMHTVNWDGLDKDGLPVPDAVFTVEMEAETTDGNPVSASTFASSRVEEVSFDTSAPVLILRNGDTVRSAQLETIR